MRVAVYILFVLACNSWSVLAAPVSFNTALPVSQGAFIVRGQAIYSEASGVNTTFTGKRLLLTTGYGVTQKLALFGVVPFGQKRLQTPQARRQSTGFGDAQVFARYTWVQRDGKGHTFRIAPFFGVELPVGEDNQTDQFGRLPQGVQSGSGAVDGFGGVVVTWATTKWQTDSQVRFQSNGTANGFQEGSRIRADTSFQVRVQDQALGTDEPAYLYAVLEIGAESNDRDRLYGVRIANSGGQRVQFAPALQLATRRWIAEASVQVPIWQNTNGAVLSPDFQTRIGLRINY